MIRKITHLLKNGISLLTLVVDFEGDSFRGQKAPTGSFSAKTLPVGPEYHAFGT